MYKIGVSRLNGLECTIDWISFTIFSISDVLEVFHVFGYQEAEFYEAPKGAMGYSRMFLANDSSVRVLTEGNDNMGIHIDVPGSGIADFIEHYTNTLADFNVPFCPGEKVLEIDVDILKRLMEFILNIGQFSRLDIAIDDHKPYFTLKQLDHIIDKRLFRSNWRKTRVVVERGDEGSITGYTVYFGRRDGDIMLRVYDKHLERVGSDEESDDPWVRWELEMKGAYADNAASKLIHGVSIDSLAVGILGTYLVIVKPYGENRNRWPVDKRWTAFLDAFEDMRLTFKRVDSNMRQKRDWILRQVAPTLSGILLADFDKIMASYGDYSVLAEYILSQVRRMKPGLRKRIAEENPEWENNLMMLLDELDENRRKLYE